MHFICINSGWRSNFIQPRRAPSCAKHGVSFADAEQALRDNMAVTIEDPDALNERRFMSLGMDAWGRILIVVYTQRGDRTHVISTRKVSRGEARQYHA